MQQLQWIAKHVIKMPKCDLEIDNQRCVLCILVAFSWKNCHWTFRFQTSPSWEEEIAVPITVAA